MSVVQRLKPTIRRIAGLAARNSGVLFVTLGVIGINAGFVEAGPASSSTAGN